MDERRTGEYRTGVAVKKLVLSEELRNKHGEIYSAMLNSMNKTPDASDEFADASTDERQDYVLQTAAMFADQIRAFSKSTQAVLQTHALKKQKTG